MMHSIEYLNVAIADVDPFEEYDKCPVCGHDEICCETSGPLTDWSECLGCGKYFHPDVQFIKQESEEEQ